MRDAAAVPNDIEAFVPCFEVFVELDFHVIEFYLYAIEQGVIVCSARRYFVERIDHLDNTVKDTLRHHEGEIAGCGF